MRIIQLRVDEELFARMETAKRMGNFANWEDYIAHLFSNQRKKEVPKA